MAEAEQPERLRPDRQVTGSSTPHFALQIRNRIARLIAALPDGDPARVLGLQEIARLERLAYDGETRGEGEELPPLPSVNV
jgi:hypothetical protein